MDIEALKRYRIGVLAGGPSSERGISLKSGRAVLDALKSAGLDAVMLDVDEGSFSDTVRGAGIDAAFIALHGRFGEDGTVQKELGEMGIPYTGSGPDASEIAMDKLRSKERFREDGLNVPENIIVTPGTDIEDMEVWMPCVAKPRYEGSSVGLSVVHSEEDLKAALEKAFGFGEEVIVEEFIPGREITVGILEGMPLPVVEIVPAEGVYDYAAKYSSEETKYICPANLGEEVYQAAQDAGLRAHTVLGCEGFSRADMRLTDGGGIFVLEVNTIPGLTERSLLPLSAKAAGLDFFELCVKMLSDALQKR